MANGISGCAIYPLSDDVTLFESEQISTIVRCQVRDAYRFEIIRNLDASKEKISYKNMTGYQAAAYFSESPDRFVNISWADFNKQLSEVLFFYANTIVSYDFSIDSSEMNADGVDFTFLKSFTKGTNSLQFTAKSDRTRQVTRHFRVFDTLGTLATKLKDRYCHIENAPTVPNFMHPSTGLLRLNSLVKNFLVQNQTGNLGGEKSDYTTAEMADTMVFTTKHSGNFDPTLTATAIIGAYVPSQVKFNADNYRQDIHTVILLLQLPVDKSKLPRFDSTGRLTTESEARQTRANNGLDREDALNTARSIRSIPGDLRRVVNP